MLGVPAFAQVQVEVLQDDLENCVAQGGQGNIATHVSMNTVLVGNIVKTIHAEKQIFECDFQGAKQSPVDVTIIAEVYEDIIDKEVIATNSLVITCVKDEIKASFLNCFSYEPRHDGQGVGINCAEETVSHPQNQETVTKNRKQNGIVVEKIIKTIITQKEVYYCPLPDGSDPGTNPDDKKVDIVLFEDVYEDANTLQVTKVTAMDFRCVIKVETAIVETCQFGPEDDITP